MSSNSDSRATSFAAALIKAAGSNYSYSRKHWNAFDAWQDHVRKSAASVGNALSGGHSDRDLRRAIIAG
jgi:hypothetical protein